MIMRVIHEPTPLYVPLVFFERKHKNSLWALSTLILERLWITLKNAELKSLQVLFAWPVQ